MELNYDSFDEGEHEPENRTVYVRPVELNDLPDEMQEEVGSETDLYALFSEEGEQLAVVSDRRMAFILARQNDLAPVSVH
ncbi:DUF1150 family protein [Cochlodiniinecator piscidefendens]|uniref:DUF1150 family protein n=1 Tax=Cochlodiniinecator piscidefendens TaxID=2715756 RepID=UPI00140AFF14|nr:DUF1150 family protein [Cochlodiniinecator piscidefendens]